MKFQPPRFSKSMTKLEYVYFGLSGLLTQNMIGPSSVKDEIIEQSAFV